MNRSIVVWVILASISYSLFCECYEAAKADPGIYMYPEPLLKSEYLIGGWNPGDTVADFMQRYEPIFQEYLTKEVGSMHNPPISFKLIPTDWAELGNESTTSHVMIEEGRLDFTCKCFESAFNDSNLF